MNPVLPATPPLPSRAGIRPLADVLGRGLAAGWLLLALTGALLAGGCAVSRDFPLPTASCEPERVADIAITVVRNVPIATVTINGKPARMVIDSGSDRSLLTPEAAARLGARADPLRSAMSRGIGGSTLNGGFIADTMEAGGLTLDGPTTVSPRLAARLGVSGPVAGTDRATRVSGLGGNPTEAFVHAFPSMTVAGLMAREPRLTVVDLPAPAMMLLGMDWLRLNRVWLAYATGHMFVRRN